MPNKTKTKVNVLPIRNGNEYIAVGDRVAHIYAMHFARKHNFEPNEIMKVVRLWTTEEIALNGNVVHGQMAVVKVIKNTRTPVMVGKGMMLYDGEVNNITRVDGKRQWGELEVTVK